MRLRKEDVIARAAGRWPGILRALGIEEAALSGKHGPCPMCGGTDRFRFDDKEGRGTYYCSGCGAGDGFALAMGITGKGFNEILEEVNQLAGGIPAGEVKPAQDVEAIRRSIKRIVSGSRPIKPGDEASSYLLQRGIQLLPNVRCHPALAYYNEKGEKLGEFAAMIAAVVNKAGEGVALHRTYLKDGRKADVPEAKKLTKTLGTMSGGAIRLFNPQAGVIGIAEGIETACAATALFGVPTWSAVSAPMLEAFDPPNGIKSVSIFADNDINYAGQAAAYRLAHRLHKAGIGVRVHVPSQAGTDWADMLPVIGLARAA